MFDNPSLKAGVILAMVYKGFSPYNHPTLLVGKKRQD
jgi:hypothetical protein